MILLILLALALSGCAHLPPTNLSVCGHTEQFETVCRAPVLCLAGCDDPPNYCRKTEEHSRDLDWEKWHVCPAYEPIEGHPTLGSCYVYAGVVDSRQVYRRVAREPQPICSWSGDNYNGRNCDCWYYHGIEENGKPRLPPITWRACEAPK